MKTLGIYENLSTQWSSTFSRKMGQPAEYQDPFFVYLIAEKLPTEPRKFWELSSKGKQLQTYQELKTFLEERVQALESLAPSNSSSNTEKRSHSQQNQAETTLHSCHVNESAMRML